MLTLYFIECLVCISYDGISYDRINYVGISNDGISCIDIIFY